MQVKVFYHDKCGPSNLLFNKVKKESNVELIHIEGDPYQVRDHEIQAVPTTLILDSNRKEIKRLVGYSSDIIKIIKEYNH